MILFFSDFLSVFILIQFVVPFVLSVNFKNDADEVYISIITGTLLHILIIVFCSEDVILLPPEKSSHGVN